MAFDRIASFVLRAAQLAFAAIVAGIVGHYLDHSTLSSWDNGRHIYTIVVAALSMLLALLWLLPFSSTFVHWPADVFMSILWFVAFGLLVDLLGDGCGYVFDWGNVTVRGEDVCGRWKAVMAFSFLSAIVWLAMAIVGFFWVRRRTTAVHDRRTTHRRTWYRSRV